MSKHMKRLSQPRRWTLARKESLWAPKTRPGPHATTDSIPLEVAIRDVLGLASTAREARRIINQGSVLVDGAICRDPRRGVGLMDVVSIPDMEGHYRVLYDRHGRIAFVPIQAGEAGWKLARIEGKTTLPKGRTQLNLHDGRNLVIKEDPYKVGDVLRLKVPSQDVAEHLPFGEGAVVYVTGGSHSGEVATIKAKEVTKASTPNIVTLTTGDQTVRTIEPYAFVVGKESALIALPGVPANV